MAEFDLSTLSGAELRGLLASTRQRGHAAQTYQILEELAERRTPGAAKLGAPGGQRRVIAVDLGDPLDRADEADMPHDDEPPLVLSPRDEGFDPPPRPARKRRRRGGPLVFAAGMMVGVVVGLGLAADRLSGADGQRSFAPFPAAPMLRAPEPQVVKPAPPVAQVPTEAPAADVAPSAPPALGPAPARPVEATAAAPQADAMPEVKAVKAAEATPSPDACRSQPTPADRTICGDLELRKMQRQLRTAYAEALARSVDSSEIRARQLAWREARNDVDDPERLMRLYKARTEKLRGVATEVTRRPAKAVDGA